MKVIACCLFPILYLYLLCTEVHTTCVLSDTVSRTASSSCLNKWKPESDIRAIIIILMILCIFQHRPNQSFLKSFHQRLLLLFSFSPSPILSLNERREHSLSLQLSFIFTGFSFLPFQFDLMLNAI